MCHFSVVIPSPPLSERMRLLAASNGPGPCLIHAHTVDTHSALPSRGSGYRALTCCGPVFLCLPERWSDRAASHLPPVITISVLQNNCGSMLTWHICKKSQDSRPVPIPAWHHHISSCLYPHCSGSVHGFQSRCCTAVPFTCM